MSEFDHRLRVGLALFLAVAGLSAVAGGFGLVSAPDGSNMGFDLAWLDGSPFNDFLVPGLVLMLGVGGSELVAAYATWRRWPYSLETAFAAGAVLFGWITIQVLIINELSFLHWLYWAVGAVMMAWAGWLRAREMGGLRR